MSTGTLVFIGTALSGAPSVVAVETKGAVGGAFLLFHLQPVAPALAQARSASRRRWGLEAFTVRENTSPRR